MKSFFRIRPVVALPVLLFTAFLLLQSPLFGQESTGNVTGVVTDATGAVIPKAVVVLTTQDGTTRTTTTNRDGAFAFASVPPSTSDSFEVTAPGFRSWKSQPFAVNPGDQQSYKVKMEVGSENASVTVEAEADSQLAVLTTGERSDLITDKDLDTLTVVGRDATELVRMLPGYAMSTGDQGLFNRPGYNAAVVSLSGPTGAFSANGSGPTGIAVVTDGVSLTDIATNSGSVQQINIEMVSEIKATSSTFSAVTAKGPAVISAVSKTGGAAFHGEAYMAARDTDLNSNDWYDNYLSQSRPAGRYLFPGGQFGGPLLLPFTSFNRNRDKLFFFAAFEYYDQSFEANQQALTAWVPTEAERAGDFSPTSLDAQLCGARPDGGQNPDAITPMCWSENYIPPDVSVPNYNANDAGSIVQGVRGCNNPNGCPDPAGIALVNWLPQPNADPFTNPFGYNYIQQLIQQQNGEQFKATLEYNIDDADRLFLIYGLQKEIDQDPVDLGSFPAASIPYPGAITTGDISTIAAARYTHTFGATVTNEFDAAMSFVSLPGKMGDPDAVDRFDMNSYNGGKSYFNYLGVYQNSDDLSVPALNNQVAAGLGYPNLLMPGGFWNNQVHTKKVDPIFQDNVSWQKGSHFLQFGVYGEGGTYNGIADPGAYPQGEFTFNPQNNYFDGAQSLGQNATHYLGCSSPNPAANLRLSGAAYLGACFNPTALAYMGYADSFTQTNFTPTVDMRYKIISGFANDTWKLHRLTLTLGARLEHLGPWTDLHGNGLATFSPALYNQECAAPTAGQVPSCTGINMPGITWASQGGGIRNSVNVPLTIYVSPRIGVAWDTTGKGNTILRGGWGIYRNEEQFNPYALASATAQSYKTTQLVGPLTFSGINSQSVLNPPDFSVYTLSQEDTARPVYYEYNGGIAQRLPWHSLLEVAFVGSHNVDLGSYNGANQGTGNNSAYNSASDINIICGIEAASCPQNPNPLNPTNNLFNVALPALPALETTYAGVGDISSLTTQEQDFYRPYQYYQHIYQLKHNFYSNYNSLQAAWNKTSGFISYGANYTFAKNLATASSYNNVIPDPVNLRNDYNPVPYDRTQVFNIHYLLDQGVRFKYTGGNGILKQVANGWQISGVSTVQSGNPLASEQGENFGFGYGQIEPVEVAYQNQVTESNESACQSVYHIASGLCVQNMSPVIWLGTPDIQLMPTVPGNPVGGPAKHQYINATGLGLPLPETNGQYRLPYIHGPYFMDHDITLLKNFQLGETKRLQLRLAAFNFLNHPLVSFNNQDTNNLNLSFIEATAGQALTQSELTYQTFGIADIKVGNRLLELGAKFSF